MNNKIQKEIIKKGATLAGGPAAGKAADIATKAIPNKNPHDKSATRLQSALNKKNQGPSMQSPSSTLGKGNSILNKKNQNNHSNQKPSDLDENGGQKEEAASKKVKNFVFGKKDNKKEELSAKAKLAEKAVKTMKVMKFIAPALPAILIFLGIFIVAIITMTQIMLMRDKINDALIAVSTGVEKYINVLSGHGWATEEELFFQNLEAKYNDALTLPSEDGKVLKLDIPLVAATINYSKMTNVGLYEDISESNAGEEDDGTSTGAFGNFFASAIADEQTRNFYYVANDKLGNYRSILPGNRRLLGHMIGYKIIWKDVSYLDNAGEIFSKWGELFKYLAEGAQADFEETFDVKLNAFSFGAGITGLQLFSAQVKKYKEMLAYKLMGDNHDSKAKYTARNIIYELEELIFNSKRFLESDLSSNVGEDDSLFEAFLKKVTSVPTPYVTFYETLDENLLYNYGDYLRRVYFPGTFFSRGNVTESKLDAMVAEVFEQRKYYEYLVGDLGAPDACVESGGFGDCGYDLSRVYCEGSNYTNDDPMYKSVKNIKVNLVTYYQDESAQIIDQDIPLEKYVLGVVYAEVGAEAHAEVHKAQAVVARAFALARPFGMGQSKYCNLKKNGDGWTLTLRGSTGDQAYCDPEKGCHTESTDGFNDSDLYPGIEPPKDENGDDIGKKYKDAIPPDHAMRSLVASTAGQITVNQDGILALPNFLNSDQEEWARLAKTRTYMDFIPEYYTNKMGNGQKITISQSPCSTGGASSNNCIPGAGSTGQQTGEWSSWRQGGSSWSNISIGSSTIGKIGCAATSVAIQLKRSGVETTFNPVDPGTFVEAFKKAGGFSGNNIVFSAVDKVAPKFKYKDRVDLRNDSNKAGTLEKAVADGCYPVLEVKKGNGSGQHWVAVVEVKDGIIVMADPASESTNAVEKYGSGLSEYICYKVEG